MERAGKKNTLYFVLAATAAALILLYLARRVVTPFAAAFALAYLLDPLVDRLESLKISRTLAVVVLLTTFFVLLVLGAIILVPLFQLQVHQLMENLPDYIGILQSWIKPLLDQIAGIEVAKVQQILQDSMKKFGQLPMKLAGDATAFVWDSLSGLVNLLLMLFNLVIIPVAMFYLLRDYDEILKKLLALVPPRYREKTVEVTREIDGVLADFVRGQLVIAALMAALYSIGLYLSGTPLSLMIGVLAGLANLVPYLGLIVGFLPALLLTFLQYQDFLPLLGVVATFGLVQSLEGMVLTPRIMGDTIGLHPVIIMLAVFAGAEFFGMLGIFLAVPVTAVGNVLAGRALAQYKKSPLYSGES